MFNLNKFEIVGIGISVVMMSLALFFIRLHTSSDVVAVLSETSNSASVIVGADGGSLNDAYNEAAKNGKVEKLLINDITVGVGNEVKVGDTVTVDYIGTLKNGQQFDNTYTKGEPFIFKVGAGKVISGWEEGVLGMKVGGDRVIVVPASMAYDTEGYGPIPGNATLVFAIKLLSVE